MKLPRPLRGIIPPLVTPLADHDALDVPGLERLVEHLLAGGVHGLFLLGTTGEAPGLSHRLRHELVERACGLAGGRVPVLVGITDTSFVESMHLAEKARGAGAQALVLAPPYYFPAGQPELLEYLRHVTARLPLPLFLYNMPSHTKLVFEPETVRRAAELPGVAGIKDSSADMDYFRRVRDLCADRPGFALLMGTEERLAEAILSGAHGGVCGGANLFPELYVSLYEAALRGDRDRMDALQARVLRLHETIFSVGRHPSRFLKGLKCALSCRGICGDFMAEPFHRFREEERRQVMAYLSLFT